MFRNAAIALATAGTFVFGAVAGQAQVLVSTLGNNPPHFMRLLSTDVGTSEVGHTMFDTLVRLDSEYQPIPNLATSWEVNSDATEFRFTIRDDVVFHDGEPLTSEDVQFTMATYLPLMPQTSLLRDYLEEISAPDETTVIVRLNKPFAPFIEAVAGLWIVPKHVYGDGQPVATHPANMSPVGSGPFRFDGYVPGERAMVVRNDDYWGEISDVERIVYPVLPDQNARILALESGDLDFMYGSYVDKASYARLQANPNFGTFPVLGGVSTVTAHINARSGPMAEYEVRRAVYQALNREMMGERAYYGYGEPARGPISSSIVWAASPDVDFNRDLPFDPAAAAAALDAAGYPVGSDGRRFTLRLAYIAEYGALAAVADVMKSNLEEIGVGVDLIGEEFNVWAERTYATLDYDLSIVFYTSYEDPSIGVARIYLCNPDGVYFRNSSGICDEEIDSAFARAGSTADRAERQAAFAEAERGVAGLLHAYPMLEDTTMHFGRQDRWDFSRSHAVHPPNWSLVTAAD